jgi:AcrR family transcriptional regulator
MNDDLNSVKTYHHGALKPALIAAAEKVLEERGIDGFSLRETARRAGVSPAAPAHHFGDARGLLTAVAAKAYRDFGDALEAEDGDNAIARLRSRGMAYVRFALANRARFQLMWRKAVLNADDPDLAEAGRRAFNIHDKTVRGANAPPAAPLDPALAPSIASWSIVHGFALLAMDGVFGTDEGAAERAAEQMLPLVLQHLIV